MLQREAVDVLRFVLGFLFLAYGALSDLKTRKVEDRVWYLMGASGLTLLALQMWADGADWPYWLILIPVTIAFVDVFAESGGWSFLGLYAFAGAVVVYEWSLVGFTTCFIQGVTILIMVALAYLFYFSNLLVGGADAKAFICIALMAPVYPQVGQFPIFVPGGPVAGSLQLVFPFAFLVLMNSTILFAFVPLGFLAVNLARGEAEFPMCLLGVKMDTREVLKHKVWLMERIIGGERAVILWPKRSQKPKQEVTKLLEARMYRVWVQHKIPFVVAMTAGWVLSFILGNFIFGWLG